MNHWIAWLLTVQNASPDQRRRGRTALIIAFGLLLTGIAFIPVLFLTPRHIVSAGVILAIGIGLLVATIAAIRRGFVTVGAHILIATLTLTLYTSMLTRGSINATPFYLLAIMPVAGITLPRRQIWLVLAITYASLIGVVAALPPQARENAQDLGNFAGSLIMIGLLALISYLGARSSEIAIDSARRAEDQAQAASAALEQANAGLEQRVLERTDALEQALAVQRGQADALSVSLKQQQQLNEMIANLSVPIIPVLKDVLIVPLIGNLESSRARMFSERLLEAIERLHVHTVLLDITGVAMVDTHTAQILLQVAAAARLLGAEALLIGVRPEVAQSLVGLGADLSSIRTAASLDTALDLLMRGSPHRRH